MQEEIKKFKLTDMRKNPQFCLALLLQQAKDEMETLRPLADLQQDLIIEESKVK